MWNDIWPDAQPEQVPITSITNGVHLPTWIGPRVAVLLARYLPEWREQQDQPDAWERVLDVPDEEFWAAQVAAKRDLFDELRDRSRRRWMGGKYDPGQVVT